MDLTASPVRPYKAGMRFTIRDRQGRPYLVATDAATRLGISAPSVHEAVARGDLIGVRWHRLLLVRADSVRRFARRRRLK